MFLEQADDLGSMPAGMAELDRKTEVVWKLGKKGTERCFPVPGRKCARQLHQDNAQLRRERLDRSQEFLKLGAAIVETATVGNLARELASEAKMRRRFFDPAQNGAGLGRGVKGGIDLDRGEKARVPLQPLGWGQPARVKNLAPFLEAPRARADSDFMLMVEIQKLD